MGGRIGDFFLHHMLNAVILVFVILKKLTQRQCNARKLYLSMPGSSKIYLVRSAFCTTISYDPVTRSNWPILGMSLSHTTSIFCQFLKGALKENFLNWETTFPYKFLFIINKPNFGKFSIWG